MQQTVSLTIPFTGGIVSPGHLREVLDIAAGARVTEVRFGSRQEMLLDIPVPHLEAFERSCRSKNITCQGTRDAPPNIVSSYPAAGIFARESWLREGVYKDVFDLFDHTPYLKINICDATQGLVPLFTGHLNWRSSGSSHFWHLAIRFPKTQVIYSWPELIYTNEIAAISKAIEALIMAERPSYFANDQADGDWLFQQVKGKAGYIVKKNESELLRPDRVLPYYEGFNTHEDSCWLGIYRRNELFPVSFLSDICAICTETKIGQLYTTTWKSLIVKGIELRHREIWDYVLGKYRINVRHAANELNWQVEDNNEAALVLKRHIVRHFDKEDVRTDGLIFAIKTKPSSRMFGSVIINRHEPTTPARSKFLERFDILYSRDFNPNTAEYILFREAVLKEHLGPYLVSLCKLFYEQAGRKMAMLELGDEKKPQEAQPPKKSKQIHQCSQCLTVYDEETGEPDCGILPGTGFNELPSTYRCSLCEAPKEQFMRTEESSLAWQPV